MSIKQQDIKLLWGRAGGLCSICKIPLSEDKATINEAYPFGEQAHIIAEEPDGPRGKSDLTTDQRNGYHNLILLCPTHHAQIDKDAHGYPIERLHMIKVEHERWLENTRSAADVKKVADSAVYASLIDAAVEKCMLENWQSWSSYANSTSPMWKNEWIDNIDDFRMLVLRAIWPGTLPELERAIKTLAITIQRAVQVFMEHSELYGDTWRETRFYKGVSCNTPEHRKVLKAYEDWIREQDRLIVESTKAANWLAENVRRDINPMFFVTNGKFMIVSANIMGNCFSVPEYTQEEKDQLPERIMDESDALQVEK